jgi:TonB family protein
MRWPATGDGDGRGVRLAALAFSLLSHAVVLLGARGWRVEAPLVPRPLIVTMLARGSGDDGGAGAAASAPRAESVAPASVVAAAAKPVPRPPAPARRAAPRARAVAAQPEPGAAVAPSAEGGEIGSAGMGRGAGAAGAGSGAGAPGSGGDGRGGGNDGLRAFCRRCPVPDYPGRARRQGWQGTVDVELAIGRDGGVQAARVGRSSGYPTLDEVALEVARQSRFAVPDGGDGLRGELRYRFVLDETAARR